MGMYLYFNVPLAVFIYIYLSPSLPPFFSLSPAVGHCCLLEGAGVHSSDPHGPVCWLNPIGVRHSVDVLRNAIFKT